MTPRRHPWLVWSFPAAWRARYGDELEALIADMSVGRPRLGVGVDVVRAGLRERLRAAGHGGAPRTSPAGRARSGAVIVLWGWAAAVLAGLLVQRSTEHWRTALGPGHGGASVAFGVFVGAAGAGSLLVALGIALALPAFADDLRRGGWPRLRGRVVGAAVFSGAFLLASLALVIRAHGLTAAQRNGGDPGYEIAFVGWALLGAATLLGWTSAGARAARGLTLSPAIVRTHTWIAAAVAGAMALMTVAGAVWYVQVARHSPAALTGGAADPAASALVVPLLAALAVMGGASLAAIGGARRAVGAIAGPG
jgi:hypothetical protein